MDCSLIVVGAHNGIKLERLITEATTLGEVILVEPVPWLFEMLRTKYAGVRNIHFLNGVVAEEDGEFTFYSPVETANDVVFYGDQLGSLNKNHAVAHDPRFSAMIEPIKVRGFSFKTLIRDFAVGSIDTLMTDTEGYDAKILATFPFDRLKPMKVCFEHKHCDGFGHIGRSFARLLVILEDAGYRIGFLDNENCLAVLGR